MQEIDKQTAHPLQWQPAPEQPWLAADDVHIWRARLDERCWMPSLRETLSLGESLDAEKINDPAERRNFVAARGILRIVLARYVDADPSEIQFSKNSNGRDSLLPPDDDIRFDLSISDGLALIAISRNRGVGVEVERVRMNVPFTDLAGHYFDPEEAWKIAIARGEQRAEMFYDLWTSQAAAERALGDRGFFRSTPLMQHHFAPMPEFSATVAAAGEQVRLFGWDWQAAA